MKNSVYANYKKIQYSTDIQESVKFMGLKKANWRKEHFSCLKRWVVVYAEE